MKTLKLILFAHFFIISYYGFSQSVFRKNIDIREWDRGRYFNQTSDGGYIITGDSWNSGHPEDALLVKTDMFGDTLWTKTYGESDHQIYAYCVRETFDGGFIVAAHTNVPGPDGRAWIIKTSAVGDTLWTRYLTGWVYEILQPSDSCYLLFGKGSNSNLGKGAITKLDQSGEIMWSKFYSESKCFYQALEISDDEILTGGLSREDEEPNSTTIDLFMINYSGDSLWLKQYGDIYFFSYLSLQKTFDGGFVLASSRTLWGEDSDIYLQKVDSNGNMLWNKLYGSDNYSDVARSVVQTSDSGFMITGYKDFFGMYLLKTNQYGDSLWQKSFNTDTTSTQGYHLIKTSDDHYAVIGEETGIFYPGYSDLIFLKADQEGLVTRITEIKKEKEITIVPNPNRGDFHLQLLNGDREVMIYDLSGRLIFDQKINHDVPTLTINGLKPGSFVIHIKSRKYHRTARLLVL